MTAGKIVSETRKEQRAKVRYALVLTGTAALTLLGYVVFLLFLKQAMPVLVTDSLYPLAGVAGVATFFSPCSFPLLPGYLSFYYNAEESNESVRPLLRGSLAAVGVVTFTLLLGLAIALLGQGIASSFSISGSNPSLLTRAFRIGLGVVLFSLGAIQLSGKTFHSQRLDSLVGKFHPSSGSAYKSFYLYGFGYNAAGIGCAGPIMAGLIVFALGSGGFMSAFMAFAVYSATMGSCMLLVSLLVAKSKTILLKNAKRSTPRIKQASSVILIGVGGFLVYATLNLQFFIQTFFPR
jgi:cytochrome c-type biogenesis protein